jgi:dTDP-4-dehydrorhamnose 3,5-epimerase
MLIDKELEIKNIAIEGPLLLKPNVFFDARGYFFESFNKEIFERHNLPTDFVQDNQSLSNKHALRGLHFQNPPFAQGKLVRVIKGAVYDIIVDIRKNSATYGNSFGIELNESNFIQLWIPEGFAHGFSTLEDNTIFSYKCTRSYHKASENGILWNDKQLNIDWQISNPIISEKDQQLTPFDLFDSPF